MGDTCLYVGFGTYSTGLVMYGMYKWHDGRCLKPVY